MNNFFGCLVVILLLTSFSVEPQAATRIYRIGFIGTTPRTAVFDLTPFRSRLRELGYLDGQNFTLEERGIGKAKSNDCPGFSVN
jgi:hypothetical protein